MENCEFRRRKTSPIQLIDTKNCYIRLVFTAWSVDKRQLLRHQSAGKLVNSMCFIHGVSEDSYVPSIKTIFGHYYYDQWELLSSSTTDKIHTSRKGASFTRWKTGDLKRVEHTNAFSYPLIMAISRVLKILFVKRTTKKTQTQQNKAIIPLRFSQEWCKVGTNDWKSSAQGENWSFFNNGTSEMEIFSWIFERHEFLSAKLVSWFEC